MQIIDKCSKQDQKVLAYFNKIPPPLNSNRVARPDAQAHGRGDAESHRTAAQRLPVAGEGSASAAASKGFNSANSSAPAGARGARANSLGVYNKASRRKIMNPKAKKDRAEGKKTNEKGEQNSHASDGFRGGVN